MSKIGIFGHVTASERLMMSIAPPIIVTDSSVASAVRVMIFDHRYSDVRSGETMTAWSVPSSRSKRIMPAT